MSGSASLGLEQQVLDHTLGVAPMPALSRVYVALCYADMLPDEDTPGAEVSGGGYSRVAATFARTGNIATNAGAVEFPAATTSWGTVGFFEIWTAATGGTRQYWGPLIDPSEGVTPLTIALAAGDIVRFPPGALAVQAADAVGAGVGVMKTDRSGTVTLNNVPQDLMPSAAIRRGWSFQNKSTSDMWFNDMGADADPASPSSTYLQPGAYYESEPGSASLDRVSIIGTQTGAQFSAREW